jgi:hypothetical protein
MNRILSGKKEIKLATHVLQFVFLGFTGFRFPLFHFPTEQASAPELYLLFWKIVNILSTFGFKIQYVSYRHFIEYETSFISIRGQIST